MYTVTLRAGAKNRGKIEIEFYGPEDLHRITRAILEGVP